MSRRAFLGALAAGLLAPAVRGQAAAPRLKPLPPAAPEFAYDAVVPRPLRFPEDHGAHPGFRTEWWYVTGWLEGPLGFQVTFFRTRPRVDPAHPSAFAARQIVIAHAALSDPARGRLLHAERVQRAVFGLAQAEAGDARVWVDDWRMARTGEAWQASVSGGGFAFDLSFTPTQPPLLQGEAGYSRKGPQRSSASHYYSLPHLAVRGSLEAGGARRAVRGSAWLDHEWSSEYLDAAAQGWDWCGINLDGGGALMAFRIRGRDGGVHWAGGAHRSADGGLSVFAPGDLAFTPLRSWRSPRTGVEYPVAFRVRAGDLELALEPLMDDQEMDVRRSTGAIYWEGAVSALAGGRRAGSGYLELTGYAGRIAV